MTLKLINDTKLIKKNHKACWEVVIELNDILTKLLDSMNDGVRTQTVKYVEKIITTLSPRRKDSEMPKKDEPMSSIDEISSNHELLKKEQLKIMGNNAFKK